MLTSEADAALSDLDKAISESQCLLEQLKDPIHPDALKADQRIAAAAHVAMEASRALKVESHCSFSMRTAMLWLARAKKLGIQPACDISRSALLDGFEWPCNAHQSVAFTSILSSRSVLC